MPTSLPLASITGMPGQISHSSDAVCVDVRRTTLSRLSGASSCAQARAITADRLAELDRKISDPLRMRDCLAEMRAICQGPSPGRVCRLMVQTIETIDHDSIDRGHDVCTCPST